MGWVEKNKLMPIDDQPPVGLWYLDGDLVASLVNRDWTKGYKLPLIVFPSGHECEIWPHANPDTIGTVHIFQLHGVVKKERALCSKRRPVE